ncbi:MAG: ACT domain-containing protein [Clostridia bacterium]|nr:ACT domain-containing protein [Clostridia bacterium]
MKAVITVTGKDAMGIIAKVSNQCAVSGANIIDISQSVLKDYFAMIMLVDIDKLTINFTDFVDQMSALGKASGLVIQTMHEEIFQAMHTI